MGTIGRRISPDSRGCMALKPADYGKDGRGEWLFRTPTGLTGSLREHEVIEHDDGTITVSPSILITGETVWHGYLEKGVWREV